MVARRCLLRAAPKKGRTKGRCIKYARPTHTKKPKIGKLVRRQRKNRCLVRSKNGRCLKRAKKGE